MRCRWRPVLWIRSSCVGTSAAFGGTLNEGKSGGLPIRWTRSLLAETCELLST
jgi:hypothetical protein